MVAGFKALNHGNPPAWSPRELLRHGGNWLREFTYDRRTDVPTNEDREHWPSSPEIAAIWTAFAFFGLPIYRPDYLDWMARYSPEEMYAGSMLCSDPNPDTLELYVQAMHRSEKWSPGSWADYLWFGGMSAAVTDLLYLWDQGEWHKGWN